MASNYRPYRPNSQDDPFEGLSGVPRWLREVGDAVGPMLAGPAANPVVRGALEALGFIGDVAVRTPVGAIELGADTLLNTGLRERVGRRLSEEGRGWWEAPRVAYEETDTAFQRIAEDPSMPAWLRAGAQVPRALGLGGEVAAPFVPGVRLTREGIKAMKLREPVFGSGLPRRDKAMENLRKNPPKMTDESDRVIQDLGDSLSKRVVQDTEDSIIRADSGADDLELAAVDEVYAQLKESLGIGKFNLLKDTLDTHLRSGVDLSRTEIKGIAGTLGITENSVRRMWKNLIDEAAEMDLRAAESTPAPRAAASGGPARPNFEDPTTQAVLDIPAFTRAKWARGARAEAELGDPLGMDLSYGLNRGREELHGSEFPDHLLEDMPFDDQSFRALGEEGKRNTTPEDREAYYRQLDQDATDAAAFQKKVEEQHGADGFRLFLDALEDEVDMTGWINASPDAVQAAKDLSARFGLEFNEVREFLDAVSGRRRFQKSPEVDVYPDEAMERLIKEFLNSHNDEQYNTLHRLIVSGLRGDDLARAVDEFGIDQNLSRVIAAHFDRTVGRAFVDDLGYVRAMSEQLDDYEIVAAQNGLQDLLRRLGETYGAEKIASLKARLLAVDTSDGMSVDLFINKADAEGLLVREAERLLTALNLYDTAMMRAIPKSLAKKASGGVDETALAKDVGEALDEAARVQIDPTDLSSPLHLANHMKNSHMDDEADIAALKKAMEKGDFEGIGRAHFDLHASYNDWDHVHPPPPDVAARLTASDVLPEDREFLEHVFKEHGDELEYEPDIHVEQEAAELKRLLDRVNDDLAKNGRVSDPSVIQKYIQSLRMSHRFYDHGDEFGVNHTHEFPPYREEVEDPDFGVERAYGDGGEEEYLRGVEEGRAISEEEAARFRGEHTDEEWEAFNRALDGDTPPAPGATPPAAGAPPAGGGGAGRRPPTTTGGPPDEPPGRPGGEGGADDAPPITGWGRPAGPEPDDLSDAERAFVKNIKKPHSPPTSLKEVFERLEEKGMRKVRNIVQEVLRSGGFVRGDQAETLVRLFDELGTPPEVMRQLHDILDPVVAAQKQLNALRDQGVWVKDQARQRLQLRQREAWEALRSNISIEKKLGKAEAALGEEFDRMWAAEEALAIEEERLLGELAAKQALQEEAIRTKSTDGLIAAVDGFQETLDKLMDVKARRVTITKKQAREFSVGTPLSKKEQAILDRAGINTGTFPPWFKRLFVRAYNEMPEKFAAYDKTIPWKDTIGRAFSEYVGVPVEELERHLVEMGLSDPGQMSSFIYAANLVLGQTLGDAFRMWREVDKGTKTVEEAMKAQIVATEFMARVGGANSEVARATNIQRVSKVNEALKLRAVEASRMRPATLLKRELAALKKMSDDWQKELDVAKRDLEMAATRGEDARVAAEARFKELEAKLATKYGASIAKKQVLVDNYREALANADIRLAESIKRVEDAVAYQVYAEGFSTDAVHALAMLSEDNIQVLANATRNLHKFSKGEQAIAIVTNNAYSGILSQTANFLGSVFRIVDLITSTAIAENVGRVTGHMTVAPGETAEMVGTLFDALRSPADAIHVWTDIMGKGVTDIGGPAVDLGKGSVFEGKKGLLGEGFLRLNASFDAVGRHLINQMEQSALYRNYAYRDLVAHGFQPTNDAVALKVAELLKNPPQDLLDAATKVARDSTYASKMGDKAERMLTFVNSTWDLPLLGKTPLLKAVVMASRFTYAATAFSVEVTGGGLVRAIMLSNKARTLTDPLLEGQRQMMMREAARTGARGAFGGAMFTWGLMTAMDGKLIGKDKQGTGRDDSILVGDTWVPLRAVWPLSAPLIYAARAADAFRENEGMGEEEQMNVLLKGVLGIADAMANQPMLRVTHDLLAALRFGGDPLEKFAAVVTARGLPYQAFMRDVNRVIDNAVREPENFWNRVVKDYPIFAQGLPVKVNRWGEPELRYPSGPAVLNPFASTAKPRTPLDEVLDNLNRKRNPRTGKPYLQSIEPPERRVGNVTLEKGEMVKYQTVVGQQKADALTALISQPGFTSLPPEVQAQRINLISERALTEAKRTFSQEMMQSGDSESMAKGLQIAISATPSNYQRTLMVKKLLPLFERYPGLEGAIDKERKEGDLTVAQYREAAGLIEWVEEQPEFATMDGTALGEESEWKAYHQEFKAWQRLIKDGDVIGARIYFLSHPTLRRFYGYTQRPGGKNPAVKAVKNTHPVLNYIRLPRDEDEEPSPAPLSFQPETPFTLASLPR